MKRINNKFVILILTLLFSIQSYAQIGIYTEHPDRSAILDINSPDTDSKGLLIPSMTNQEKLSIVKPAHSLLVYDTDLKCISQNKGTESSPSWNCLTLYNRHFFYMPSVNIKTSDGTGALLVGIQTLDLYGAYKNSFSSPAIHNPGALDHIPYFEQKQLNFYVTYCDPCISILGISDLGEMSYKVNYLPDYDAYINIVFVVK